MKNSQKISKIIMDNKKAPNSELMDYYHKFYLSMQEKYQKDIEEKEELRKNCKHDGGTYTECTDYHKRDFGTFCKICDTLLHDNGEK